MVFCNNCKYYKLVEKISVHTPVHTCGHKFQPYEICKSNPISKTTYYNIDITHSSPRTKNKNNDCKDYVLKLSTKMSQLFKRILKHVFTLKITID